MLVMKCSRLLRFGSMPSVKLLKAVIGISPPLLSDVGKLLLCLRWRRCGQVGMPNIGHDLPCPGGLFFKELDVFAAGLDRRTAGVSHCVVVGAAPIGDI